MVVKKIDIEKSASVENQLLADLISDPGDFGVITFNALIYKDLEK